MGILGLTHDQSGVALEKLPVAIKVAIGEAPEPGNQNSHPSDSTISYSNERRCAGRRWFGSRRRILPKPMWQNQPNLESSSCMMIPRKSSGPNMPGGQRRGASAAANWCKTRTGIAQAMRCGRSVRHVSIPKAKLGRASIDIPADPRRINLTNPAAMVVPIWSEETAVLRATCISC